MIENVAQVSMLHPSFTPAFCQPNCAITRAIRIVNRRGYIGAGQPPGSSTVGFRGILGVDDSELCLAAANTLGRYMYATRKP